ncbi:aspartyl/asparaginyl beta-hydroxylase domain-containing protein [Nocardia sp. XZ_19_369]|uniref:aspartyl/asparaginyl beta-hydroxylase domain-containing protein n=1 Tax=Nocardia sp. XZ_19_369 TaxID=2769487 RepID=UPI001890407B|nr:aspartyl/asparaginyl beta-hydroxylase domain-containing protein [Nocardia sp. XZ_19_369]
MASHSKIGDTPFFDPGQFPWSTRIEADWPQIRSELDRLLRYRDQVPNMQDISVEQAALTTDDNWKVFFFYAYGRRFDRNCATCPATAQALAGIPGMTTAFFSILGPGKHLPMHRGPYKGVVRYHLGLKVPDPVDACGIRVGGEVAHWREGASMFFDDTYPHEAWNTTESDRVVLFVDVVRPVRQPYSLINRVLLYALRYTPFVRGATDDTAAWDRLAQLLDRDAGDQPVR